MAAAFRVPPEALVFAADLLALFALEGGLGEIDFLTVRFFLGGFLRLAVGFDFERFPAFFLLAVIFAVYHLDRLNFTAEPAAKPDHENSFYAPECQGQLEALLPKDTIELPTRAEDNGTTTDLHLTKSNGRARFQRLLHPIWFNA